MSNDLLSTPRGGSFQLIKPLVGFKADIEKQLERFPYEENVFMMLKFRESNRALSDFIIETLKEAGLRGVRADSEDWDITGNVYNPLAVLYCCKFGIALFDEPEEGQAYSPNVAYELGIMHYQAKQCLILRHTSLPPVPFDLIKDLHKPYHRDLEVRSAVQDWVRRISEAPGSPQSLPGIETYAEDLSANLSQGGRGFPLRYHVYGLDLFSKRIHAIEKTCETTWNDIKRKLLPRMLKATSEGDMRYFLKELVIEDARLHKYAQEMLGIGHDIFSVEYEILEDDFHTIKIQLDEWGLIQWSENRWSITPKGNSVMRRLVAVRPEATPDAGNTEFVRIIRRFEVKWAAERDSEIPDYNEAQRILGEALEGLFNFRANSEIEEDSPILSTLEEAARRTRSLEKYPIAHDTGEEFWSEGDSIIALLRQISEVL